MDLLLALHSLLQTYNLMPNRALGQNFCVDEARLRAIAEAACVSGQSVLEVGPGLGALTRELINAGAKRVVAVEKDKRLSEILRVEIDDLRLRVVAEDFLSCDVRPLMGDEPFVACGNLPYYATTPIVERLLCLSPVSATLMVQKEAAERFFAAPSTRVYGPLAVLTRCFYTPVHIMDVPRTSYYPHPAVDSVVVRLRGNPAAPGIDRDAFLLLLKQLFGKRRKTIKNNYLGAPDIMALCERVGISPSDRAEAIPPETLLQFYLVLSESERASAAELIRL